LFFLGCFWLMTAKSFYSTRSNTMREVKGWKTGVWGREQNWDVSLFLSLCHFCFCFFFCLC
jgi:hypothetical protein